MAEKYVHYKSIVNINFMPTLPKASIELMLLMSSWVIINSITLPLVAVLNIAFSKLARMFLITGSVMETV